MQVICIYNMAIVFNKYDTLVDYQLLQLTVIANVPYTLHWPFHDL